MEENPTLTCYIRHWPAKADKRQWSQFLLSKTLPLGLSDPGWSLCGDTAKELCCWKSWSLLLGWSAVLPGGHSAGTFGTACLKLLLHGVLLPQNPWMWLCWQSSSVQKKMEFNIPSCHIPYTSRNRILCSGKRFNTLGHLFQNKSTDSICKQYFLCI